MRNNMNFKAFLTCIILCLTISAKTVKYELNIENRSVNLSGKKEVDFAIMVNGSIPAPTLEFTEGDTAEITVNNKLSNEETSTHWHGLLLPSIMDGVAYVNTPPILPGKSFTFSFKIRQHGTYWYHSHTTVQEQKGVYGAIIIHPKNKTIKADKEIAVVLSDWSDENATNIMKNLRKDGDYYLYKKDSIRSYLGAIQEGSLKSHLGNEWIRMGGMDLSDVGYDAFLINGKIEQQLLTAHPGEKIRLRIINAAASSYFYVSLGNIDMKVISADGTDIKETYAKEILIGMAETYDVLFTVPEHKNYELKVTVQDLTGSASAWIGMGEKVYAPTRPMLNLYGGMDHSMHDMSKMPMDHSMDDMNKMPMDHSMHDMNKMPMDHSMHDMSKMPMDHSKHDMSKMQMDHSMHDMNKMPMDHSMHTGMKHAKVEENKSLVKVSTLTVDDLQAKEKTSFSKDKKVYDLKLVLGGDMERYVWHINNKAIYEDRNIFINEGDVVRFTFVNETMMHHPMHLHGHFFRVINKFGEFSPLKHTVDVGPHGTRTIEFYADEPGQWMLHCHNLYHMKSGMGRVVRYNSFTPTKEMAEFDKQDPHRHDHIYFDGKIEATTRNLMANFRLSKTWDTIETNIEATDYDNLKEMEADLLYRRWVSNFLNLIVGVTYNYEYSQDKTRAVTGVGYLLPMLIESEVLIDHKGKLSLNLEKKFQWTKNIYSDIEVFIKQDQDTESEISLMYANQWNWSAGLKLSDDKVRFGGQYRF